MHSLILIWHYTIATILHEKLIRICGAMLLLCITFGWFLTTLSIADTAKIYIDCMLGTFHLGMIAFVLVYVTPFFGTEQKTMLGLFFTHGISKTAIFYGCVAGFYSLIIAICIALSVLIPGLLYLQTGKSCLYLWPLVCIYVVQSLYLVSLGLFCSMLLSRSLAGSIVLVWYACSFLINPWLVALQQSTCAETYGIAQILYYLVPDFTLVNIQPHIMYELPFDGIHVLTGIAYILCYTLIMLAAARWQFYYCKLY